MLGEPKWRHFEDKMRGAPEVRLQSPTPFSRPSRRQTKSARDRPPRKSPPVQSQWIIDKIFPDQIMALIQEISPSVSTNFILGRITHGKRNDD